MIRRRSRITIGLAIALALALGPLDGAASADEETPPPVVAPPPAPAEPPIVVVTRPRRPPPRLHLQLGANGGYLHLLGQSFGGGAVDIRIGASNQIATLAFRANGLFGRSAGGLGFERAAGGFQAQFQMHDRVRFGLSFLSGIFVYQRASAADDRHVYAASMALLADLDVELARGKSAGALVWATSLGYEYVHAIPDRAGDTFSAQTGLAWRY